MILEKPHNWKVDIWSLGICMLEVFLGNPPYPRNPFKCMVLTVAKGHIDLIPQNHRHLNKQGIDFLTQCLTQNAHERPSAKDLLNHPWIMKNAHTEGSQAALRQLCLDAFSLRALERGGLR